MQFGIQTNRNKQYLHRGHTTSIIDSKSINALPALILNLASFAALSSAPKKRGNFLPRFLNIYPAKKRIYILATCIKYRILMNIAGFWNMRKWHFAGTFPILYSLPFSLVPLVSSDSTIPTLASSATLQTWKHRGQHWNTLSNHLQPQPPPSKKNTQTQVSTPLTPKVLQTKASQK